MRIVGVDDGAFPLHRKAKDRTLLVAVLFDNLRLLNVICGQIEVDGRDANKILQHLLRRMRFDAVMLSGLSFAGFNVVDIASLSKSFQKPVIAVIGERPHNQAVRRALCKHFTDWKDRWSIVRSAGKMHSFTPLRNEPRLYFEVQGAPPDFAKKAIASTAVISRLPEPVRVARILARGLGSLTEISAA
jgi:endonuclease V-like protein UPF0215 family